MDLESKKSMNDYYSGLIQKYGDARQALGIGFEDDYQQVLKFSLAATVENIPKYASILDVGMGLGHLCDFFRKKGWEGVYTGIDINPDMIAVTKKRLPKDNFSCVDLLVEEYSEKHDYVFCISTLQHKPKFEDSTNYVKEMLAKLFNISNKALVFDLFSNKVEFTSFDNLYVNPSEVLDFCYSLTNRLVFRNDYKKYQFMMFLYKEIELNEKNTYKSFYVK